MGLRFDNAQLLSAQSWGSVVGYAGIGVICSSSSSAINRSVDVVYKKPLYKKLDPSRSKTKETERVLFQNLKIFSLNWPKIQNPKKLVRNP